MKLQLALDVGSLDECMALLLEVSEFIDIVEVGTPLIIRYGMEPVRLIKATYPNLKVIADAKIMDAGELEADHCFEAGADLVSVLGVSHDATISGVVKSARKFGKEVLVDMICVADLKQRSVELEQLGVDYICVHTAFDVQSTGANPLSELETVNQAITTSKSAVAGGVKLATIDAIVEEGASIIVVGGAIAQAENPKEMASKIKGRFKYDLS